MISKKLLKIAQIIQQSKNITPDIQIIPIEKGNKKHIQLIQEGCNLDSIASDDELWSVQDVKNAINRKHKQFFLLYSDQKVIGMCAISGNILSGFAIFEQYQGKGYGKKSLKEIIKKIRNDNNEKEIILRVASNNTKAINLYKSCGFEIKKDEEMDDKSFIMVLK